MTVEFHNDDNGEITTIQVPEGTKITEAATKAGVYIPTLCHHPRLTPVGRCGLCVVSVENGPTPVQLACSTACRPSEDGVMKVHVHGKPLNDLSNAALRRNLENSLVHQTERFSNHHDFAPCGTLEIEDLAEWVEGHTIDTSSNSITFDPSLCIGCSRCVRACDQLQGMKILDVPLPSSKVNASGVAQAPPCMTTRAGRPLKDTDCISCGQCTIFCPTGAIREVDHTARVMRALSDPNIICVLQTAPSVRVTIAEMFGGSPGGAEGKLVGAAKACGFRYVFDTNLSADLTIIEEANELLHRIKISTSGSEEEKKKHPLPMFTSCCPGWINLVEQSYPELIPHLSTCRSPMAMLSSVIRHHWWPRQVNLLRQHGRRTSSSSDVCDQSSLFVVAVMPCTAKKDEIAREQFRFQHNGATIQETNAVLTVREFARLVELRGIAQRNNFESFDRLPELIYDNPFGESTGAAIIFGVTGGVMEAALRTAADVLSNKNIENVQYDAVRGLLGIKEATVQLGADNEISLNVAVCHQMRNVREFLSQIEQGEKQYHFIEIMTCPGGCIGGGGLPQSRDPDIISKRTDSVYSLDERMIKRKSHHNEAVKELYNDLLVEPLSTVAHDLLHTHYFARPRKPPVLLQTATTVMPSSVADIGDDSNTVLIVFATQSGTAAQAAKEIKVDLQHFILLSKLDPEPNVSLVAANSLSPEMIMAKVQSSLVSIFVTSTYGEGEFPETMLKLWDHLEGLKEGVLSDRTVRFAVFGLGSSMYAVGDQFNRAARRLDRRLSDLGGIRVVDVGLGDDQDPELYRGGLSKWIEALEPKLFGQKAGKPSFIDPPEPLFRIALAPGTHGASFRPLPPGYHFVTLESVTSLVSEGYDRPASLFSFSLEDTGLEYNIGDHLSLLPRNPTSVVRKVLSLYHNTIRGQRLLSVEPVDKLGDCPFPPILTADELLSQYLDLCGRPSRSFFKQLFLFATTSQARARLRSLFEQSDDPRTQEEFEEYTLSNSYADVLADFRDTALPPFEYLLSMIPTITPRLYSIASSPLFCETRVELLIVLNQWLDPKMHQRCGLATNYLFRAPIGEKLAIQIKPGILQPPKDPKSPILMFGLGTGVAPFRAFLQHREMLQKQGEEIGAATLYVAFRHEADDFYLKYDYEDWKKQGVLTDVHAAFSHDNLEQRDGKLYLLPDLMADHPEDVVRALGLRSQTSETLPVKIFYCGPALGIPETIKKAMSTAVAKVTSSPGTDENDAKTFLDTLAQAEDRFHAECF